VLADTRREDKEMKIEVDADLPIVWIENLGNRVKPVAAYLLATVQGTNWVLPIGETPQKPIPRQEIYTSHDKWFATQRKTIAEKRKELDNWETALDKEEKK
jgi:hypothetical protein